MTLPGLALEFPEQSSGQKPGPLADAEAILTKALAIQQPLLGPTHPDTALVANSFDLLALRQGDRAAALERTRGALPAFVGNQDWEASVGSDPGIAELRDDLLFRAIVDEARRKLPAGQGEWRVAK